MYVTLYTYNPIDYPSSTSRFNFEKIRHNILNCVININDDNIGRALITYFDYKDEYKQFCHIDFKIISINDKYIDDYEFTIVGPVQIRLNIYNLQLAFNRRR